MTNQLTIITILAVCLSQINTLAVVSKPIVASKPVVGPLNPQYVALNASVRSFEALDKTADAAEITLAGARKGKKAAHKAIAVAKAAEKAAAQKVKDLANSKDQVAKAAAAKAYEAAKTQKLAVDQAYKNNVAVYNTARAAYNKASRARNEAVQKVWAELLKAANSLPPKPKAKTTVKKPVVSAVKAN